MATEPDAHELPLLTDVVTRAPAAGALDAAARHALEAALAAEADAVIDDLMDEFLPLIEARLRERLELRRRELIVEQQRSAD